MTTGRTACAALLACAMISGCLTERFPEPEPYTAAEADSVGAPARFAARVAPVFEQVNAVVFRYMGREMTALGMVSVDRRTRSFAVTCMTPLGVKLFDVICRDGRAEGRFVMPELAARGGNLAETVGDDLMRAYFDWSPPEGAAGSLKQGRLVVEAADASGVTEYRYAWSDGRLAEKCRIENGRRVWTVSYRAYVQRAGGLEPSALVIENHRYRYRLDVALREEVQ